MTKSTSVNIAKITWKHILKISDAQDAITDVGILNVEDRKKLNAWNLSLIVNASSQFKGREDKGT